MDEHDAQFEGTDSPTCSPRERRRPIPHEIDIGSTEGELDVQGEIAGVRVRGRVDLLDIDGRLVDIKTASRRPSWVSPDYTFQLATYRQITPGASGEARIDCLVKTNAPQIVQQSYTVGEADLQATRVLFPLVREAMWSGTYCPNRQSILCSQKHCGFWKQCEQEYGGRIRPGA